jgi:lipid A oxidase
MSSRLPVVCVAIAAGLCLPWRPALAEVQISVFGGLNENLGSTVRLDKAPASEQRSIDWEGKSFEMPPYWGVRGTYWLGTASPWGVAIEFTHAKAVADLNFATDPTYSRLEFTDGNNLLTANLLYRFSPVLNGTFVPYVGAGAGVAIPHVEVSLKAFPGEKTYEYQLAGPAAQAMIGFEYKLSEAWSVFSEAKLSYSHLNADLTGGGQITTHLWSPQLAIGLSYRFSSN